MYVMWNACLEGLAEVEYWDLKALKIPTVMRVFLVVGAILTSLTTNVQTSTFMKGVDYISKFKPNSHMIPRYQRNG